MVILNFIVGVIIFMIISILSSCSPMESIPSYSKSNKKVVYATRRNNQIFIHRLHKSFQEILSRYIYIC